MWIPLSNWFINEEAQLSTITILLIFLFANIRKSFTKTFFLFMQLYLYSRNFINSLFGSNNLIIVSAYTFSAAVKIWLIIHNYLIQFVQLLQKINYFWSQHHLNSNGKTSSTINVTCCLFVAILKHPIWIIYHRVERMN